MPQQSQSKGCDRIPIGYLYPDIPGYSPGIFDTFLTASTCYGDNAVLVPLKCRRSHVESAVNNVRTGLFEGMLVDIELSSSMFDYVDAVSGTALSTGVIDSLYWKDGKLVGNCVGVPALKQLVNAMLENRNIHDSDPFVLVDTDPRLATVAVNSMSDYARYILCVYSGSDEDAAALRRAYTGSGGMLELVEECTMAQETFEVVIGGSISPVGNQIGVSYVQGFPTTVPVEMLSVAVWREFMLAISQK